jgi:hypothetical protein
MLAPYALQPKIKIDFFYDTLAMLAPYTLRQR